MEDRQSHWASFFFNDLHLASIFTFCVVILTFVTVSLLFSHTLVLNLNLISFHPSTNPCAPNPAQSQSLQRKHSNPTYLTSPQPEALKTRQNQRTNLHASFLREILQTHLLNPASLPPILHLTRTTLFPNNTAAPGGTASVASGSNMNANTSSPLTSASTTSASTTTTTTTTTTGSASISHPTLTPSITSTAANIPAPTPIPNKILIPASTTTSLPRDSNSDYQEKHQARSLNVNISGEEYTPPQSHPSRRRAAIAILSAIPPFVASRLFIPAPSIVARFSPGTPWRELQLCEIEESILDVFSDDYLNRHFVWGIVEILVGSVVPELKERGVGEVMVERGVVI